LDRADGHSLLASLQLVKVQLLDLDEVPDVLVLRPKAL
jgi:hypothetical protein